MTERKPDGISWESWIERQIGNAQQSGAFDELTGHGRPIDGLGVVHDEMWWVKAKLRDEGIEYLPPTIAIRAERARAIDASMSDRSEQAVRDRIESVNERIRHVNRYSAAGPPSTAVVIDTDAIVDRWRAARPPAVAPVPEPVGAATQPRRTGRWWRHLRLLLSGHGGRLHRDQPDSDDR